MRVLRYIFISMVFICLAVGLVLVLFNKSLINKKKYTAEVAEHKALKLRLIGYVFFMLAFAFAIFQTFMVE